MVSRRRIAVTDPRLLAQLNDDQQNNRQPVNDPNILAQLNGDEAPQQKLSQEFLNGPSTLDEHPIISALKRAAKTGINYEKGLGLGALQGFGDVGASIGNVPSNIIEHFTGKKPYHIPHPNLRQYYPEGSAGNIGGNIGEFVGGTAVPVSGVASKAYKAGRYIPGVKGALARVGLGGTSGGLIGAASNEDDRLKSGVIGTLLGTAGSAIPEIYQGGKAIHSYLTEPNKIKAAHEEAVSNALHGIEEARGHTTESQQNAANLVAEQERQNLNQERKSRQNIQQQFPNYSPKQVDKMVVESVKNGINKLNEQFNKRFNKWGETAGKKTVSSPFSASEADLKSIGVKNPSAIKQSNDISPSIVELSILDESGNPYKLNVPGKNATVNDYLNFYRTTRDLAGEARSKARDATVDAHRLELQEQAKSLSKLSNDAFYKIKQNVTSSEFDQLEKLHNDYGRLKGEFYESPELTRAYYGNESHQSHTKSLTTKNKFQNIHNWLLENEPGYLSALKAQRFSGTGHPLHSEDLNTQANGIINLGKTEQESLNLLTPQQINALQHHINISHQRGQINKLKSNITTNPLQQFINQVERKYIKGYSPKIGHAIDRIEEAQNKEMALVKEAKILGLKKDDLQRMINERDKIKKLGEIGLKVLGANNAISMLNKIL